MNAIYPAHQIPVDLFAAKNIIIIKPERKNSLVIKFGCSISEMRRKS